MTTARHLRPDEIELLLDGEEGFGVQPLQAHVRSCASCRAELEAAREVLLAIDDLPHFAPSAGFADKVMLQVQVFEPWHVAARNAVLRFVPESRPARVATAVGAAASATVVVGGGWWVLNRADLALLLAESGLTELRTAVGAAGRDVLTTVLGTGGVDALVAGGPLVATGIAAGFAAMVGGGVLGLRALTTARRR